MKSALVLAVVVLLVVAAVFFFVPPYPQPQSYFAFADDRTLFGIPNFWNVSSNALFLLPGIAGSWLVSSKSRSGVLAGLFPAYHVFFAGVLLTAFGSAWFHLAPDSHTLFWDRLPMTIAFMSLLAIVVGEHVSLRPGKLLLWPLLVIGAFSVIYWDWSESRIAGDLRFYGLVQFLPLLLIPAIMLTHRSVFDRTGFIWLTLLLYLLAKACELLDAAIYNAGQLISGHSIKHVLAAAGPAVLIVGGIKRRLRDVGD